MKGEQTIANFNKALVNLPENEFDNNFSERANKLCNALSLTQNLSPDYFDKCVIILLKFLLKIPPLLKYGKLQFFEEKIEAINYAIDIGPDIEFFKNSWENEKIKTKLWNSLYDHATSINVECDWQKPNTSELKLAKLQNEYHNKSVIGGIIGKFGNHLQVEEFVNRMLTSSENIGYCAVTAVAHSEFFSSKSREIVAKSNLQSHHRMLFSIFENLPLIKENIDTNKQKNKQKNKQQNNEKNKEKNKENEPSLSVEDIIFLNENNKWKLFLANPDKFCTDTTIPSPITREDYIYLICSGFNQIINSEHLVKFTQFLRDRCNPYILNYSCNEIIENEKEYPIFDGLIPLKNLENFFDTLN